MLLKIILLVLIVFAYVFVARLLRGVAGKRRRQ
jgi:hypothetical protein